MEIMKRKQMQLCFPELRSVRREIATGELERFILLIESLQRRQVEECLE